MDGNLHGNVTVFTQAPVLLQCNLQQTREDRTHKFQQNQSVLKEISTIKEFITAAEHLLAIPKDVEMNIPNMSI